MATFVYLDGLRGVNLDLIAEWVYEEKRAGITRRVTDTEPGKGGESYFRLTFMGGQTAEFTGQAADALHRYFCTYGRSLT